MAVAVPSAVSPDYTELVAWFDAHAAVEDRWRRRSSGYHDLLRRLQRALIPPGSRVLEIGSGRGDLLAALEPSRGVGVDISPAMVAAARTRHPGLEFLHATGENVSVDEEFDYIVLSDLVPYVDDLQALFANVAAHCSPGTRVIVNTYSQAWKPALGLLAALRLRPRRPTRNWVAPRDLVSLFELAGLEPVVERTEILLPVSSPSVSRLFNGLLVRLPGLRAFGLTYWLVGRVAPRPMGDEGVTVLVPCRNESGHVEGMIDRIPEMGTHTEILFVEGNSTDDTREQIEAEIARHPERDARLIVQTGKGKGNAVREGFAEATQEILMILDGDLAVAPEELPKFYDALISGRGEVINGTRLVYARDEGAMRFLNVLANKAFATLLSFVLGQYVKDTLCGTKVVRRTDWERIQAARHEFDQEDPYGDFELLLGASLLGLKILNVPIRYGARAYGEPNIDRFNEGPLLARLALGGFRRLWVRPVSEDRP